jgi:hypothetical protein
MPEIVLWDVLRAGIYHFGRLSGLREVTGMMTGAGDAGLQAARQKVRLDT